MFDAELMKKAIATARKGILAGDGGPFGSIVVRDGEVIGMGHNKVLKEHDPVRHGEIVAIEQACDKIGSYDLSGCELYTTGEPCTMCLCACLWANIKRVYYGCTIHDNAKIGFRDEKFDRIFSRERLPKNFLVQGGREECLKLFDEYYQMKSEKY